MLNVSEFIVNTLGCGVKICILLGCKTAGLNLGDKIGTPVDNSKITGGPPPMEMNNNNFGNNKSGGAQPMYGGMQGQQQPPTNSYGGGGVGGNPYGGGGGGGSNNRFSGGGGGGGGASSAPIVRTSGTGQPITPISGLNMYSNRWTIRAKVSGKSDIKTWSNAKGEGSLFSMELLDSSGVDV